MCDEQPTESGGEPPFSRRQLSRRIALAVECAGALYLACAVEALVLLWLARSLTLLPLLGTLAAPAIASLLLVVIGVIVPGLIPTTRITFPLNATLPFVFCSFLYLAVTLGPGSEPEILRLREVMQWSLLWAKPGATLIQLGIQICFLSLLIAGQSKRER